MKIRKMMTSMTLAASMTLAQIPFAELSMTASALDGSASYIATQVFGIERSGDAVLCNTIRQYRGSFSTSTPKGTVSGTFTHSIVAVDPRITGEITVKHGYSNVTINKGPGSLVWGNTSSADTRYTTSVCNYYDIQASTTGSADPSVAYDVVYTPSAEDIANHVSIMTNKDSSCLPIVYTLPNSVCQTGSIDASYYHTLTAGQAITMSYTDTSIGLCLGDITTYIQNGAKWVSNPTSSFTSASVSKTYLDADFSAGFTTNSNGAVTYSSSVPGVATIGTDGKIHIVAAGTTTITAKTASTSTYNESTTTMTLTVGKATPTLSGISATKIEYNQTLASSMVTGTAKVGSKTVAGTWSWSDSSIAPNVGTASYGVKFTPSDANINPATGTCAVTTVAKSDYDFTVSASAITYGDTLSASMLTKSSSVAGTITWDSPSAKPASAGSYTAAWTFTPSNSNYAVKKGTTSVTVNKAPLTVNITSIGALTYGQTLNNAAVQGTAVYKGNTVSGHFSWVNGVTTQPHVSDSGSTNYQLQFIPDDSSYETFSTTRTVIVNQAAAITNPSSVALSATPITYLQPLSSSVISASSALPVAGHFEWVDKSFTPSVSQSGTAYAVKFIPDNAADYKETTGLTCVINVNPATPSMVGITLTGTGITYGQTLADSTISGSTPVAGRYEWASPNTKPSVSDSNSTEYDVVFIPSDDVNYIRVNTKVKITVAKATPVVTDSMKSSIHASAITYGDTLADSTLDGTTPVDGRYVWQNPSEAPDVGDSDRTSYAVKFVPTDTINYNVVEGLACTLTVNKATPNITGDMQVSIHASAIIYGQSLADSMLTGTMPVDGRYIWADTSITPSVSNSNTTEYEVTFVPDDLDNYNVVTGLKCKLTVNKATPVITDDIKSTIIGSDITYKQTLAASVLSGDTPVPGHYEWSDSSIVPSVSDSNNTDYSIVLVPDDTVNYTTAACTIRIKINPLTPTVTDVMRGSIAASGIVYEQSLADSILTGDVPIPGHYEWSDSSIKPSVLDSGTTPFEITFVPDDSVNYTTVSGITATLEVMKATPVISSSVQATLKASTISYGETLGDSVISGDVPLAGHWEWQNADLTPTVSDSNLTEYVLIFMPHDADNYNTASTTIKIAVDRAVPYFTSDMITASDIAYGDSLADSVLTTCLPTLNGADITGSFAWADAGITPDAGDREYDVVFTPDDTVNFTTATISVPVTIHKIAPDISSEIRSTIVASDITYGQTLVDSTLTGDVVMNGHYEWVNPDTKPTVSDSGATPYDIIFKPDDSNYADVMMTVTVKVNKAVPVISSDILSGISASPLDYGQRLSESYLSGATPAAGKYVWKSGDEIPTVNGENNFTVTFIPSDLVNYEPVDVGSVHVTVNKSDPQLTEQDWLAIRSSWIIYGQTLGDSPIYNDSSIPGRVTWVDSTIKPTVADSQRSEYEALFVPNDTDNYNMVRLKLKITVHKAIPQLPDDITGSLVIPAIKIGQSLSDSEITCSDISILPGKFSWADPKMKPTMADSDTTPYDITFVPDDTVNYETVGLASTIHVDKRDINPDDPDDPDNPDNPINPAINTKDSISVKSGADVVYDISKSIRIKDYTAAIKAISDPNSIIDSIVIIKDNTVSFKIKTGVAQSSADLVFTITSDTYKDFDFTLAVVVDECAHNGATHLRGKIDATWDESGYTGDLICDTCGVTLKYGEVIPALKTECKHTKTHTEGKVAATCQSEGYTGDIICDDCKTVVTKGTVQAKTAHIEGEPVIVKAATRTETGIKAWYCTLCGEEIRTEVIPKLTGGGSGGYIRPSRPIRPTVDPVDPVIPDKPDPTDPVDPVTPYKPDPTDDPIDPVNPDKPGTDEPDGPVTDEPGEDKPVTEEPTVPDTNEPGEDESDDDKPGTEESTDLDTDESGEDKPAGETNDTFEPGDFKDTSDSDDGKRDDASDSDGFNSDNIPDNGVVKQVGIAAGDYEHTPDDGHMHRFGSWTIKSGNPHPVYDHICEDCGLIEEVASDTDPNTWGTDSDNPYTGVDTMPVAASGISAVIAAAIALFRRRKNN
jgi:hypothetical protein